MRILRTSAALTATALLALGFTAGPASAASSAGTTPRLQAANSPSTNFAGYAVGGAAGAAVTTASTQFTLPAVTCPASPNQGVLPLAQVFSSTAGTVAAGGVFVACVSGTLIYQNFLFINGTQNSTLAFTPVAGDVITVSVSQTATKAKVTLKDVTQSLSQVQTGTGGTDDNSNIGDGAVLIGGNPVGNPAFGTITFSKDKTNGVAIGTLPNTAFNETTTATGGKIRILTSALNAAGNKFKTTYKRT